MKEQAIQKIKKIGKISSIIALIGKILVGIGLVCALIGAIICFVIPDKTMTLTTKGVVELEMNLKSLGFSIPEEELDMRQAEMWAAMNEEDEGVETLEVVVTQDAVKTVGSMDVFTLSMRDVAWLFMLGLAALVMTFITLCFIGSLCKAFRDCNSPFESNVIRKMQNLAYSLIPWALVSTVTDSVSESLTNNKPSFMFTVDLGIILIVLVVLVLAYIFKYGAVLQQEADETL